MSHSVQTETINGLDMKILQETIGAIKQDPGLGMCHFRARNKWNGGSQNRTTIRNFYAAKEEHAHKKLFKLDCDEPPMLAGSDDAPNPVEHLLNALAGCVTTSMVAHAAARGIHISELESELEGDIDLRGFLGLDPHVPKGYTAIRVKFRVKTDEKDMERLKSLAEFSPVLNTLTHEVPVEVTIEPK